MAEMAQDPVSVVRRHSVVVHRRSNELTDRQAALLFEDFVEVHRETLIHDPVCGCCAGLLVHVHFEGI